MAAGASEAEKNVSRLQTEANAFHERFWAANNADFKAAKRAFVAAARARHALAADTPVPDAELAAFYKDYLNDRRAAHRAYNREWWRRNLALTVAQARALLSSW